MRPFPDASGAVAKPRRGKQRSFLFFQGEKSFCLSNSVHSTRKKTIKARQRRAATSRFSLRRFLFP